MFCFRKTPDNSDKRKSKLIDLEIKRESKFKKHNVRILFLGASGSGKTTILKQIKIIHLNGFSTEERLKMKVEIYGNVHTAIYSLIVTLKKFGMQMAPMAFKSSTKICEIGPLAPDKIIVDYIEHLKLIWDDSAIQQLYQQQNKFLLIENTKYFLDKLDIIFADDYIPTDADILRSRTTTHGVAEIKLSVNDTAYKYNLTFVDIGGCSRTKWVQLFEGVAIVLFMVACSSFDELDPITDENHLFDSLKLFRSIWHNKFLRNSNILLYLNKIDLLEEKLMQGKKISNYFFDFAYFDFKYGDGDSVFEVTKHFIRYKFEKIASEPLQHECIFTPKTVIQRECQIHFLVATNTDEYKVTYEKCKHTIIMRALKIFELH